jgi:hypothetical protein
MNGARSLTILAFLWLASFSRAESAWHLRNPFPLPTHFSGLAYGNNRFLAVGDGLTIATSSDGEEWFRLPNRTRTFRRVVFGNDRFVAMGWDSLGVSTNGVDWAMTQTPELYELTFLNGNFFAIGWRFLATSTDGSNWTNTLLPEKAFTGNIGFGHGVYVFLGDANPDWHTPPIHVAATSADGLTWTKQTPTGVQIPSATIAFGNGVFLRAGWEVGYSTNGINWTRSTPLPEQAVGLHFINGKFIAFGPGFVATSFDGSNWRTEPFNFGIYGLAFGSSRYVGVGTDGGLIVSDDMMDWRSLHRGSRPNLRSCVFANGRFVAVGHDETTRGVALTSTNGRDWSAASLPGGPLLDVAYGDGNYVTVGSDHAIHISQNAIDWSPVPNDWPLWSFQKITYANGRFVAIAWGPFQEKALFSSDDGLAWTKRFEYGGNVWRHSLTSGNGVFVAVGIGSMTNLISHDGVAWQESAPFPGFSEDVHLSFGNGRFVAIRDGRNNFESNQEIFISTNGISWTSSHTNSTTLFKHVDFCENTFVVIGWDQTLFTSVDGVAWTHSETNLLYAQLNCAAGGNGMLVIVGDQGTILQRADNHLRILGRTVRTSRDGLLRFSVEAPLAIDFSVEGTTDFLNWFPIQRYTNSSGYLEIEQNPTQSLFYRLNRSGTIEPN